MTIRFGIVGPGKVAQVHADAIGRIPEARLTAVAGRNETRAAAIASPYDARVDANLATLIERGGVDAVILCTPHPLHAEGAIAAAQAGLHVVVEKPMALHPADAERMIEAAGNAGVVLSIISQRRWYEASLRVKDAIDTGRIGEPALATVEVLGWRGPEYFAMDAWRGTAAGEGGGVLVNQAVHQLDLVTWLLGPAVEIDGWVANVNHPEIEVEDSAVAVVRFASGALATIIASNSQRPGLYARIHVHGTSGASVGVETDGGSIFVAGLTLPSIARNDLWTIPGEEDQLDAWAEADRTALAGVDIASHYHELQLRDVVDAIRDGRSPAVSGDDGLRTVDLMAGIYDASGEGRRVILPERGAPQH
jgi:UDP-N-acetyl-2-amino-2-deoxyglucuronate dehydrogenase